MAKLLIKIVEKGSPIKEITKDKPFLIYPDKSLLEVYLPNLKKISDYELRKAISELPWKDLDYAEILIDEKNLSKEQLELVYEMIFLKSYVFDKYKTKNSKTRIASVKSATGEKFSFAKRDKLIDSVYFCRDIISANAKDVNPGYLEELAKDISKKCPQIKLTVVAAKEAEKLGMNCLLAVGKESLLNADPAFHPRLLVLEFNPEMDKSSKDQTAPHLALVGKGITFDTGGLCLKPNQYMLDMKSDMAGAATVLSLFHLISNLSATERKKIKTPLTGVLALAENAFGAASYKPGDVLKALNGKTVQVVDTDAEGRLVLADALSYLSKLKIKPTHVIDLATLTGSIVATLGEVAAGAMTNDEKFLKFVQDAFSQEGEKLWQMPILEEYKKKVESDIADLAHCSSRPDALIAAEFLSNFIPKDSKWVHLDIAGVGFIENDGLFAYKGATGFGLRGLYRLLNLGLAASELVASKR